ncbi:acetyl-CoA C-acyltransferase [Cryobacterium suzukii]|uniref:Acetyl-CoA C-acyltransferase n=1 Tax=Cryobacterium suzukii TaxID=1259198 RepID=A0A4R9AI47_9MICO|nr:acetyl-CoA C-acyltransferase [Cryobacterium suzukii]TFD62187.1 acetyl-CoA C-acyltransferase [Cryobacterium suzukii]
MRDAVIVEAVRTPVGKRNGGLSGVHPVDLSASILTALATRSGVDPAEVDDVIWGCVMQVAEQSLNLARTSVLAAGWPESVPATTVDRQCGSSQQAVHSAAAGVISGQYEFAVAGGVESMSRVPMFSSVQGADAFGAGFRARYNDITPSQGDGAELIAQRWNLSRTQLDEFALGSHSKAAAAQDAGRFDQEIAAFLREDGVTISADEGVRRGGTIESMAGIRTAFKDDGVLTAGNSSQMSDAASALLITTSENASKMGLKPIVRIHTAVLAADDPIMMLTAPIPATKKALDRAGLSIDDIGAFEINEAFASVPLAWLAETGADPAKLNPNGGAIALGHPLGGSGGRIMTTLIHHMQANGIRYGLQSMCEGGGQANATILELL